MAKKQKKHHISRAAEKPDRLVEIGERALTFTRTHIVWIALLVVTVVVGIFVISRLVTNAQEARAAKLLKLHQFEEKEFYDVLDYRNPHISIEENIAKAESYLDRFRTFAQDNIDDDELAPRILYTMALNSLLLTREYYDEGMAEQGIWACDELINKHSGSEIAGALDFLTRRNRIEVLREQLQDLRDKLAGIKDNFDPEGLWTEQEEEPVEEAPGQMLPATDEDATPPADGGDATP